MAMAPSVAKEELITKYAILTCRSELRMHVPADVQLNNCERQCLTAETGTLVKVFHCASGNSKTSYVQILDFVNCDPIYENLYECISTHLHKVSEDLWPYVISIVEPERRVRLVQDQEQCRWVFYLKTNDFLSVPGELFGQNAVRYDCIIRYIGPVQELQSIGYFFGLELLHLDSGYSLQSENIPFAIKYMQCDPSLSLFVTADWISPLPSDVKKKFSAHDLISDTLYKFRTVIGSNNCGSGESHTLSLRRKPKKREATAQFYDIPKLVTKGRHTTQECSSNLVESSISAEMERWPNVKKSDSNEKILQHSDEFTQSIETYEKCLQRPVSSNIPSTQTPVGILKHRRILSISAKDNFKPKQLAVTCLDDREIVIDKVDTHESRKNEAKAIVVDKPSRQQDVDLADILGGNWPNTAGDAVSMLNKVQKQYSKEQPFVSGSGDSSNSSVSSLTQTKIDRNRSPNPLSHLSTTRMKATTTSSTVPNIASIEDCTLNKYTNFHSNGLNGSGSFDHTRELALPELDLFQSSSLQEVPDSDLGVGSMVEISIPEVSEDLYGVIRWIGVPPNTKNVMVGVELEDDPGDRQLITSSGSFNGVSLFRCHEGRALFVIPERCTNDRRFVEVGAVGNKSHYNLSSESKMFGQLECPSVPGAVAPLKKLNLDELDEICGKFKGIQGHHNSCYLDATLFSMFTFTSVFDSLLFRPPESDDIQHYLDVQKVLRDEIVNPLRKNVFVRADRVMKLRQLLDKLGSVSGLTSEEKDPEEFLNSLLAQIMRVDPFLKLNSGQDAYFYQLFVEKDERLSFPTVQQLFEQSFHSSDIKLKEVPSCLIIQMPRFGKNYKMYPRILPSQVLDVTDIIEDSPRQCSVCGKLAEYECGDCFGILQTGVGLESTAFCRKCLDTVHMHTKRSNHNSKKLLVPQDFRIMAEHMTVPRLYMELFAVVCIETSHYVAFVKAGSGPDAPWCFFDSMADRKGEKNGYNIPEMISIPDLPQWLSEDGAQTINEASSNDKMLPEHAKRLFCDAYMCMYQSTDVMMYR